MSKAIKIEPTFPLECLNSLEILGPEGQRLETIIFGSANEEDERTKLFYKGSGYVYVRFDEPIEEPPNDLKNYFVDALFGRNFYSLSVVERLVIYDDMVIIEETDVKKGYYILDADDLKDAIYTKFDDLEDLTLVLVRCDEKDNVIQQAADELNIERLIIEDYYDIYKVDLGWNELIIKDYKK